MENQVLSLEKIEVNKLPELQGFKEKQEQLVKENPFIEIVDNKTYLVAKQRRTNLVKGRTPIEKQDKLIASRLKTLRTDVSQVTKKIIAISLPHEEKQQTEVKRYEAQKEQEKLEKQRLEKERVESIEKNINVIYNSFKSRVDNLIYEDLESNTISKDLENIDTSELAEFEPIFQGKKLAIIELLTNRTEQLELQESQRIEAKRLEVERNKLQEEKRVAKIKADAEAEERRKQQELIDAENKRKSDEIEAERKKLEDEKQRQAKLEAERVAKLQSERLAKEQEEKRIAKAKADAEAESKRLMRIEALKPEKEKIQSLIESLNFSDSIPSIEDKDLKMFLNNVEHIVKNLRSDLIIELNNL